MSSDYDVMVVTPVKFQFYAHQPWSPAIVFIYNFVAEKKGGTHQDLPPPIVHVVNLPTDRYTHCNVLILQLHVRI